MGTSHATTLGLGGEGGSAGKVFLIILGALVLIGIAVWSLWKPVILPLFGEAIPHRVTTDTHVELPTADPQASITVPEQWVVQREVFDPETLVVRTPDFELEVSVSVWSHGAAPSVKTALREATEELGALQQERFEILSEGYVAHSVLSEPTKREECTLTVIVGQGTQLDAASLARVSVTATSQQLETYMPAVADLINSVEGVSQ